MACLGLPGTNKVHTRVTGTEWLCVAQGSCIVMRMSLLLYRLPSSALVLMHPLSVAQTGFYTEGGKVHCPTITTPIDDDTILAMRHAYQAAVSWMDHQIGEVLNELDSLGLTSNTLVLLHGDQYVSCIVCRPLASE